MGVDGCRAGWFCVAIDAGGGADFGIAGAIADLWAAHGGTGPLLIDIPIGLISTALDGRACDAAARGVLKPLRHSSIFSPPFRQALGAPDYAAACRVNGNRLRTAPGPSGLGQGRPARDQGVLNPVHTVFDHGLPLDKFADVRGLSGSWWRPDTER